MEGDNWNRGNRGEGGGSPGEQRAGEGFILGRKAGAEIKKKHTRILFITVYHPVLRPVPI